MSDAFTLTRSGRPPLCFRGELLAQSDGEHDNGKRQNRWHDLAIYRTAAGRYVVALHYRSRREGEVASNTVQEVENAARVTHLFRLYDPTAVVLGHPENPRRHARVLADVGRRHDIQVNVLLARFHEPAQQAVS